MGNSTSFKVKLHGFDQRSEGRMATIFKVSFRGKFEIDTTGTAPVSLVDIDHENFQDFATLTADFPEGSTILLSEAGTPVNHYRVLHKPVKLDLLRESLLQAFAGLAGAAAEHAAPQDSPTPQEPDQGSGNMRVVEPPATSTGDAQTFDPSQYFAGWLMQLMQDCPVGHSLRITTWKAKSIIIDPVHNGFYSNIGKNELRNLSITPLAQQLRAQAVVQYLPGAPKNDEIGSLGEHRLDKVFYFLAQMTSKGRCPKGTDLESAYYLEQWPSFTRLPTIPNGIRMAAAWFGEPQRLPELSRRLSIPAADVYVFFFFCQLLGITGVAQRSSDRLTRKPTQDIHKKHRVLASLFGHISRKLAPQRTATSELNARQA